MFGYRPYAFSPEDYGDYPGFIDPFASHHIDPRYGGYSSPYEQQRRLQQQRQREALERRQMLEQQRQQEELLRRRRESQQREAAIRQAQAQQQQQEQLQQQQQQQRQQRQQHLQQQQQQQQQQHLQQQQRQRGHAQQQHAHQPRRRNLFAEELERQKAAQQAEQERMRLETEQEAEDQAAEERHKWVEYASLPEVRERAATTLSSRWRGHHVRQSRVRDRMADLAKVVSKVEAVRSAYEPKLARTIAGQEIDRPARAVLRDLRAYDEELTRTLLMLDSIPSGRNPVVREYRKSIVDAVNRLLERIDTPKRTYLQRVRDEEAREEAERQREAAALEEAGERRAADPVAPGSAGPTDATMSDQAADPQPPEDAELAEEVVASPEHAEVPEAEPAPMAVEAEASAPASEDQREVASTDVVRPIGEPMPIERPQSAELQPEAASGPAFTQVPELPTAPVPASSERPVATRTSGFEPQAMKSSESDSDWFFVGGAQPEGSSSNMDVDASTPSAASGAVVMSTAPVAPSAGASSNVVFAPSAAPAPVVNATVEPYAALTSMSIDEIRRLLLSKDERIRELETRAAAAPQAN